MNKTYEVFDPRDGVAVVKTFNLLLALRLAILWNMDYATEGEGWLQ